MGEKILSCRKQDAVELGVIPAMVLHYIEYWCKRNASNPIYNHNGQVWAELADTQIKNYLGFATVRDVYEAILLLHREKRIKVADISEFHGTHMIYCTSSASIFPAWVNSTPNEVLTYGEARA